MSKALRATWQKHQTILGNFFSQFAVQVAANAVLVADLMFDLVIETGACDLEGGSFVLTAGGAAYVSADVLWREFRLSEGDSGCQ